MLNVAVSFWWQSKVVETPKTWLSWLYFYLVIDGILSLLQVIYWDNISETILEFFFGNYGNWLAFWSWSKKVSYISVLVFDCARWPYLCNDFCCWAIESLWSCCFFLNWSELKCRCQSLSHECPQKGKLYEIVATYCKGSAIILSNVTKWFLKLKIKKYTLTHSAEK